MAAAAGRLDRRRAAADRGTGRGQVRPGRVERQALTADDTSWRSARSGILSEPTGRLVVPQSGRVARSRPSLYRGAVTEQRPGCAARPRDNFSGSTAAPPTRPDGESDEKGAEAEEDNNRPQRAPRRHLP